MQKSFLWNLFLAGALAAPQAVTSTASAAGSVCTGNTAADRSVWCDYDIQTDWYTEVPDTGVTVEYWFDVQNVTVSPDGIERMALAVNGSIPGPTIEANWGDTVVVHVTNSMENNGTGIHWHGIRQNNTNWMDGVPSITQCPIAPGESMTYTWRATQYGSSWYHSHFSLQAWVGVFGPMVIHGPASGNYDEDMGPVVLSDWSHQTADELYSYAQTSGPPTLDNGLINGLNVYNNSGTITGSRWETSVTSGSSYRMRLVNTAIDTHYKFMIDNHTLTVIAMDFVPIEPYTTNMLDINMGQRYDVVVTADQDAQDYWIRAIPQLSCSSNDATDNIRGILRYDSTSTSDPTTTAYDYTDECVDEPYASLVPAMAQNPTDLTSNDATDMPVTVGVLSGLFKWYISSNTMAVQWEEPTNLMAANGQTNWTDDDCIVELPDANVWAYFVIETAQGVPHPFHLHGKKRDPYPPQGKRFWKLTPRSHARRPRLLDPRLRHGNLLRLGHAQHGQPAAPRRRDPPGQRLRRHRLLHRQPRLLAHALPHRLAHVRRPGRSVPRARLRDLRRHRLVRHDRHVHGVGELRRREERHRGGFWRVRAAEKRK